MFKEKRLIHHEVPQRADQESIVQTQKEEVSKETLAETQEFAEGTADVILAMETGNADEAAMAFYKTYLETPDKVKRYINFIAKTTFPLLLVLEKLPIFGKLIKLQAAFQDKAIDKLFDIMRKIQGHAPDAKSLEPFIKAERKWDSLSPEEQNAVKTMVKDVFK